MDRRKIKTKNATVKSNTDKIKNSGVECFIFSIYTTYCLNTIFQKLHFSKSYFSETPQEKYDPAIYLQPMSPKKCRKKLKIGSLLKKICPKIILNRYFACAREVIRTP